MAVGDVENSVKEFLALHIVTEAAPAAVDKGNITATLPRLEEPSFCARVWTNLPAYTAQSLARLGKDERPAILSVWIVANSWAKIRLT